jgi:beta-lactamase class D
VLPFRPGDVDWQPAWRQPTDPAAWMRHSVVWYSQRISQALGAARFRRYVGDFGYGNADGSGDPGQANGLARSWIGSSPSRSRRRSRWPSCGAWCAANCRSPPMRGP